VPDRVAADQSIATEKVEFFACWTDIDIALGFIAEAIRTKELGAVINIRERNVGADVLIFDSDNVLFSAIFVIPCHLARPQFPAEAGTPEQVEHRLVLHHLRCRY
jgi:hypothetical protein